VSNDISVSMSELLSIHDTLYDALSGWNYIRGVHGELYGVGFDRVEKKLKDEIRLNTSRINKLPESNKPTMVK